MERGLQKANQHSRLVEWGRRVEACRNSGQRVSEWVSVKHISVLRSAEERERIDIEMAGSLVSVKSSELKEPQR